MSLLQNNTNFGNVSSPTTVINVAVKLLYVRKVLIIAEMPYIKQFAKIVEMIIYPKKF